MKSDKRDPLNELNDIIKEAEAANKLLEAPNKNVQKRDATPQPVPPADYTISERGIPWANSK